MTIIYEKVILITKEFIDMNSHVNNVVFLQFMQDVALEHSAINGYTLKRYKELQTTWMAKKHCINYIKPVFLGQKIKIKTWIDTISKTFAIRKYEFFNEEDNTLVCEAESTWVYIDLKKNRPCKIDEDMKKAFLTSTKKKDN